MHLILKAKITKYPLLENCEYKITAINNAYQDLPGLKFHLQNIRKHYHANIEQFGHLAFTHIHEYSFIDIKRYRKLRDSFYMTKDDEMKLRLMLMQKGIVMSNRDFNMLLEKKQ